MVLNRKFWKLSQRKRGSHQQALKIWEPRSLPTWSYEGYGGLLVQNFLKKPGNASWRWKAVWIFASELKQEGIHCYRLWIWLPRDEPGQKMIVPAGEQIHSVGAPESIDLLEG